MAELLTAPRLVTEDEAIKARTVIRSNLEPQQKASSLHVLDAYLKQRNEAGEEPFANEARQRQEAVSSAIKLFTDDVNYGFSDPSKAQRINRKFLNNPPGKDHYLAAHFLTEITRRPFAEVRSKQSEYMGRVSKQILGEAITDSTQFRQKIGTFYKDQENLAQRAQQDALAQVNPLDAAAAVESENAQNENYQRYKKQYREAYRSAYRNVQREIAPYSPFIGEMVGELQKSMGVGTVTQGRNSTEEDRPKDDAWFVDKFLENVPPEDEDMILSAMAAAAGDPEGKNFFQKVFERFGRTTGDISRGVQTQVTGRIQGLAALEQGVVAAGAPSTPIPDEIGFDALNLAIVNYPPGADGSRPTASVPAQGTPEYEALSDEQKTALERIQKEKRAIVLYDKLNNLAVNGIDPAQGSNWLSKGVLGVSSSAPHMISMGAGRIGMLANISSYQGNSTREIIQENPGMDWGKAGQIGTISGIGEGALDLIPTRIIQGKLPGFNRFLSQSTLTKKALIGRATARVGGGAAFETAQEFGQEVTRPIVQNLFSAFDEEVPGSNLSEHVDLFFSDENLSELIPTVFMFGTISGGVGSLRDYKNGRWLATRPDALIAAGYSPDVAGQIAESAGAGKWDEAQGLMRGNQSAEATDTERKEAAQRFIAQQNEEQALFETAQEQGVIPKIRRTKDGWTVGEGESAVAFDNYQEAVAIQLEQHETESISLHQLMRDVIGEVNSQIEEGREIDLSLIDRDETLLRRATLPEGDKDKISPEAALTREALARQQVGEEVDLEAEFAAAKASADLFTSEQEARLMNSVIVGENSSEFAANVQKATIKLFQNATPFDYIQEKAETDVDFMLRKGQRDWLISALTDYETKAKARFGDKIAPSLFIIGKETVEDSDIKEAYSHLVMTYAAGRSKDGAAARFLSNKEFQKFLRVLFNSRVGGILNSWAQHFKAIFKRAAQLNTLRKEGALDAELEAALKKSIGLSEQAQYEQSVEQEAGNLASELEAAGFEAEPIEESTFEPTDDAPFSIIRLEDRLLKDNPKLSKLILSEDEKAIEIKGIEVAEGERGSGVGGLAIDRILEYADSVNKPVVLTAQPDRGKKAALERFYKGKGFKKPGRNRDYSLPRHTHIYEPKEQPSFSVLPRQDQAYIKAVESGDMEVAQKMVDEAARKAGYDSLWFHGSSEKFRAFDEDMISDFGFHIGTREQAGTFSKNPIPLYFKGRNLLRLDDLGTWNYQSVIREARAAGVKITEADYDNVFNQFDEDRALRRLLESRGYDGIIYENKVEGDGDSILAFHPSQMKSADPVTYDENGDVILLSKRFDETRDEISFSVLPRPNLDTQARLDAAFAPFQRSPEQRVQIAAEMKRRVAERARTMATVFAANRTNKDIETERRERQGEILGDKLGSLTPAEIGALEAGAQLDDAAARPILSELLTRKTTKDKNGRTISYWGGSLMSKSEAKKRGFTSLAEWDDMPEGLPPYVWGGSITPDQAADQFGYSSIEAFGNALKSEIDSFRETREAVDAAQSRVRELEREARDEAKAVADEAYQLRDVVGTDRNTLVAALRTLDAILSALPAEVRGKVGGYTKLATLKNPRSMLEEIERRMIQMDKHLETYLVKESKDQIQKYFDKAKVKKTPKGVPKTNLPADTIDEINEIKKLTELTESEHKKKLDDLNEAIEAATDDATIEALTDKLIKLVGFGHLEGMKSEQLSDVAENLKTLIEKGRLIKAIVDEERRREVARVVDIVNNDVTGGKGRMTSSEAKKRAQESEGVWGVAGKLAGIHRRNLSFEWLINGLARENPNVGTLDSNTHKEVSVLAHKATHEEKRRNQKSEKEFRDFLSDLFKKKGVMLSKAIGELSEEVEKTDVFRFDFGTKGRTSKKQIRVENVLSVESGQTTPDALGFDAKEWAAIKVAYGELKASAQNKGRALAGNRIVRYEVLNRGKKEQLMLSQEQAINLTMLYRQEKLRASMVEEGYSEETMKQMEEFLSPQSKAIRDWLTNYYDRNYDELNPIFKSENGVSLPKIEFYSPAVRKAQGTEKNMQIDSSNTGAMTTTPSFLISRVDNFAQMDQSIGAISLYARHAAQTNHYIAWAKPMKKLRGVFGNAEVKKNIEDYRGKDLLKLINERLEWFSDGGNRSASYIGFLDNLRSTFTISKLAYNLPVFFKQLTSIPAYAFDMPLADFTKYSAKFWTDVPGHVKEILSTEYAKARWAEGYERDVIASLKGHGGYVKTGLQTGMLTGKAGDIIPVIVGGWMAKQRAYDIAIKEGYTEKQAQEQAVIAFEMSTDRAQQAGDLKDLSHYQGGGSIARLFTMFKTSPRQYYANVYESLLDFKAGKKGSGAEFSRRFLIGHVVLPLVFQLASDALRAPFNDEDDEDFDFANYVRAVILGPLNGLFILGDFGELATSGITDTKIWFEELPIFGGITKGSLGMRDLWDGDLAEGADRIARGIGESIASPFTYYDILRRELDRLNLIE